MTPLEVIEKRLREYPYGGDNSAEDFITTLDAAGFVIVPKEPTEAMLQAFRDYRYSAPTGWARGKWLAMLSALPRP